METKSTNVLIADKRVKLLLLTSLFVAGNVILPQICHHFGMAGKIYLPIMFFTLIAAMRFGVASALGTAILSPVLSNLICGMPSSFMLAVVIIESVVLAGVVAYFAKKGTLNMIHMLIAIVAYVIVGFLLQAAFMGSVNAPLSAVLMSWPGVAIQLITAFLILKIKK